ncbi:hypothetical protein DEDE109153_15055 [Deinococcus deserti]
MKSWPGDSLLCTPLASCNEKMSELSEACRAGVEEQHSVPGFDDAPRDENLKAAVDGSFV